MNRVGGRRSTDVVADDDQSIDLTRHPASPEGGVDVVLRIADPFLRVAIEAVLDRSEVHVHAQDDGRAYLLTDDPQLQGKRTILVLDETSGMASQAVRALIDGRLRALASRLRPDHIPAVIASVAEGLVTVPSSILVAAARAPELTERQLHILALLSAGMSNSKIALRLHLSEATIKREISGLLRTFMCSSRVELAIRSAEAGYGMGR